MMEEKNRPWLSILIPVYNVEEYLEECLESILRQTGSDTEIICIDDASTDNSLAILQVMERRNKGRFKLMQHSSNRGLSAARNTMLAAARGDYIWFIDSDDLLMPGAIKSLREIIEKNHPDLVMCDFQVVRTRTRLKHRLRGELHRHSFRGSKERLSGDQAALLQGMLSQGQLHIWSKISKRSLWGNDLRFPEGKYFEDMYVTPRLLMRTSNYYHASQVWIGYRQRAGSILSSMSLQKMDDMSNAMIDFREEFQHAPASGNKDLNFAASYFSARNFICVSRNLHKQAPAGSEKLATEYRENFLRSIPMPLQKMRSAYLKRGWVWRWLRLSYWLKKAEPK